MSARTRVPTACPYVVGEDGLARWSEPAASAWLGLLQTHRQLTRELDAALDARYRLSLSGLELLGRLAAARERTLRLSRLAQASGLSLSRVSRIVDGLEQRGLVERRACPEDARATNVRLTGAGLELARRAQASHFDDVRRSFVDRLSDRELRLLAAVFARLATPRGAATRGTHDGAS